MTWSFHGWPRVARFGFLPTLFLAGTASLLAGTTPASAEIKRIEIDSTLAVSNDLDQGNEVGAYELITGRAFGAVDPNDPLNTLITDIQNAPRSPEGLVEYETKFTLAKPKDISNDGGTP